MDVHPQALQPYMQHVRILKCPQKQSKSLLGNLVVASIMVNSPTKSHKYQSWELHGIVATIIHCSGPNETYVKPLASDKPSLRSSKIPLAATAFGLQTTVAVTASGSYARFRALNERGESRRGRRKHSTC
eukprot:s2260_g2.t1